MGLSPLDERLLSLLVDPATGGRLRFESGNDNGDGELVAEGGRRFPILDGIPRFVELGDVGQAQTSDAFGFKWGRTHTYQSSSMRASATEWLLHRYGFASTDEMRGHLEASGSLLDIGCGAGYSTSLWFDGWQAGEYVGVDISSAIDLAKANLGASPNTHFVQADALHLPFAPETFGAVIAEGVLHHTPSTRFAILEAARTLRSGGEILFYVYRRKSPVREWTDDYVRGAISDLSNEDAWKAMEALTQLGRALASIRADVEVPVAVDVLGIPAGRVDVQRLIYWHFAKVFWNDGYSFDENVHVNFDWYRPSYAHRQTEEQVRRWCQEAGLEIFHFDQDPAGFTIRAVRTKE